MVIVNIRVYIGICNEVVLIRMILFLINIIVIWKDGKIFVCSIKINS